MKTKITELFGIKYPILLSGMSFVSEPKLVAAVSNAGGLGILATGNLNPNQTKMAIAEIRTLTDKPFGANATLMFPGAVENAKVLLEEKVPIINFALGKGDWIAKAAHEYGGKVIATVVNARHAKRAQDYGCDAVIATGYEAAAHGGDVATLVLVPSLVDVLEIPVIAAGGIGDGRGLAAALALGAEGIAMGSRFCNTIESQVHENPKKLTIEKNVTDTIRTAKMDGMAGRGMDTPGLQKALKRGLGLWTAFMNSFDIAKELETPYLKLLGQTVSVGIKKMMVLAYVAMGFRSFRIAIVDGDTETGIYPIGQVTGLINDIPTVEELIQRIVTQAKETQEKMGSKLS